MSLEKFYELRENFIILGLTGKMQAGADEVVKILNSKNLGSGEKSNLSSFSSTYRVVSNSEATKYRRLGDFYKEDENWREFKVIEYKNVILLFILQINFHEDSGQFAKNIANWILEMRNFDGKLSASFGFEIGLGEGSKDYVEDAFLVNITQELNKFKNEEFAFLKDDEWIV